MATPNSPVARRAVEARISENCRIRFHCSSEELQRRVIAAKRGAARRWAVYRLGLLPLSTGKTAGFSIVRFPAFGRASGSGYPAKQGLNSPHAVLRPYSCAVLGAQFRGTESARNGIANGGSPPPSPRPVHEGPRAVIDGSGANRHRAGVIQRPAGGIWGGLWLRQAIFKRSAGDGELGPN
jgi:hypothetical protein